MIDIYNHPTDAKSKEVTVLCHTSLGDPLDEHGRFFLKGKEYKLTTEIRNNQEYILCWISFNEGYGERFAIKGNVYHDGEPRWSHFTDYFVCPIQRERDNKLNEIGICNL